MEGLVKLADSTMGQDFLAGIDPTGVNTFQNALTNEEDHLKHQLVGDVGGAIGGGLVGTLAPAALMGGTSLAMRKFNPGLADEFSQMSKGTLDALNPGAMKRYVSSLGDLTKFKNEGSEFLNETKKLNSLFDGAKKGQPPTPDQMEEGYNIMKNLPKQQAKLNETENKLSQQYFKGKPVSEGGARAFTALSTAGAGALSGAMGGMGAHMQYNTGKRVQEMNDQEKQASLVTDDEVGEAYQRVIDAQNLANEKARKRELTGNLAGGAIGGIAGLAGGGALANKNIIDDALALGLAGTGAIGGYGIGGWLGRHRSLKQEGPLLKEEIERYNDVAQQFNDQQEKEARNYPFGGLMKVAYAYKDKNREECMKAVSFKEDKDGVYAYTHRSRSKSYPNKEAIPTSVLQKVERTA